LVLDNVGYHRKATNPPPNSSWKKAAIIDWLRAQGVSSIVVTRNGRTLRLNQNQWGDTKKRQGTKGASKKELLVQVKLQVTLNPSLAFTDLQLLFKERTAAGKPSRLIFTPPYHSSLQPIELMWASVKNKLGDWYESSLKLQTLRSNILKAIYGESGHEADRWLGITPRLCASYIRRSDKVNYFNKNKIIFFTFFFS